MDREELGGTAATVGESKHVLPRGRTTQFLVLVAILGALWAILLRAHGETADQAVYFALRHPSTVVDQIATAVTMFGSGLPLQLGVLIGAVLLLCERRPWSAASLIVITISGESVERSLKVIFGLPRPDTSLWLVNAHGFALPSGHTTNSTIVYLSVALLLTRMGTTRGWALVPALVLTALVGLSRVVLGVHWPTDVVAGWSFGAFWALVWCYAALKIESVAQSARTGISITPA